MLALLASLTQSRLGSVARFLERNLVEAGVDAALRVGLPLRVRHNQAHLGNLVALVDLSTKANVGEGDEPTRRYYGAAAIDSIHRAAAVLDIERSGEGTVVVGDVDDVGSRRVIEDVGARLDGVRQDVILQVATDDAFGLSVLQLLADAGAYDLHVDARPGKENVLVLRHVSEAVLAVELRLADDVDVAYVDDGVTFVGHDGDIAVEEFVDGLALFLFLLSIGLAFAAGTEGCG